MLAGEDRMWVQSGNGGSKCLFLRLQELFALSNVIDFFLFFLLPAKESFLLYLYIVVVGVTS